MGEVIGIPISPQLRYLVLAMAAMRAEEAMRATLQRARRKNGYRDDAETLAAYRLHAQALADAAGQALEAMEALREGGDAA